jgi:hypothetical protein
MSDLMAAVLKIIDTDKTTPTRDGLAVRCYVRNCWKPATITALHTNGRIGRYCTLHSDWADGHYAVATHSPIATAAKRVGYCNPCSRPETVCICNAAVR